MVGPDTRSLIRKAIDDAPDGTPMAAVVSKKLLVEIESELAELDRLRKAERSN